ncbi:hypothetical protein [Lujinxingia vulgaris]|uniref:hypothetical protein n=1 Tax=Lujinxingia vulgaris TaxID=2600176 RepID=UPI001E55287D|nr:hypothetical protein [Lujinxingia vulgaris]
MSNLLHLSPAGSGVHPDLLKSAGGFAWWYLDLIDEKGDGLVCIWSFGLPFLPGYANAARRGQPQLPKHRPSLNLASFKGGKLDFYVLQEFAPEEVFWDAGQEGDRWTFGLSALESVQRGEERVVKLDLHLRMPDGQIATALIEAQGPAVRHSGQKPDPAHRLIDPLPDHDWTPLLCHARARATLRAHGQTSTFEGRVYHDRNGGQRPMHELGIDVWTWGRLAFPSRELIYYVLHPTDASQPAQTLVLEIDAEGETRMIPDLQLRERRPSKNLGGLRWWPEQVLERDGEAVITIDNRQRIDSGPFYLRSAARARDLERGESARGISEVCDPARIDLDVHRPLVRMRVMQSARQNSIWLPLFTGPRQGRVSRLAKSFLPGAGVAQPEQPAPRTKEQR